MLVNIEMPWAPSTRLEKLYLVSRRGNDQDLEPAYMQNQQ